MCGRYGRRADKQRIAEWMHTHNTNVFDDSYFAPSYNVAPQSLQPVVRLDSESGQRELTVMRWGLVPFWAKDAKIGYSTINAKSETVTTSRAYREAMKRRRCLVPAEWFYEWQKIDTKTKQPYAIGLRDGSLFAFAGLWETWKDKTKDQVLETYTVLTTDPNELMEPIHNRMPVILAQKDYQRWLEPGDPDATSDVNAWPTPRSWEMASNVLTGFARRQQSGFFAGTTEIEAQLLEGTIGEAATTELVAFLRLFRQLPSIDEILLNPDAAPLPDEPSARIAIATALGRALTDHSIPKGIRYLDRMPTEMRVLAMRDAAARDRAITHTPEFIRFGVDHAEVLQ